MYLIPVEAKKDIKDCQDLLGKVILAVLDRKKEITVGFQGANFDHMAYVDSTGFWYASYRGEDHAVPRYWNAFGSELKETGGQNIVVEINPALSGLDGRVSGFFAKSSADGSTYLLHRGRVGGGRKGINKNAFLRWYRGADVALEDSEGNEIHALLVGCLDSAGFVAQLKFFVSEVKRFKEEVSTGKVTRRLPDHPPQAPSFNPEDYGKKLGGGKRVEYFSYHGLIVNALAEQLVIQGEKKQNIFNTQLIDLGVTRNATVMRLYEIKCDVDRQSVYTGVGQLLFHSGGDSSIEKVLVLPTSNSVNQLRDVLNHLDIGLLEYEIAKGSVQFKL